VLDRTNQTDSARVEAERPNKPRPRRAAGRSWLRRSWRVLRLPLLRAWQFFVAQSFSSLTRRIVSLNVAGLVALVIGVLYLSQFRAGLIDARIQALLTQGESFAQAIAWSAIVENASTVTIDPERLLELQTGESYGP